EAHEAVQPADRDLAAAQLRDALQLESEELEAGHEALPGEVHQVTREVEREPAVAERRGLEAVAVRHGYHQHAAGAQQAGGVTERIAGVGEVLERVPEDDRRPLALHL